jgi:drug/metabolite transporter (DMT)-like permease
MTKSAFDASSGITMGNYRSEEDLSEEDLSNSPTLKRVPVIPKQTPLPPALDDLLEEDLSEEDLSEEDLSGVDTLNLPVNRPVAFPHRFQRKHTGRTAVIALLLLLLASSTVGIVLISRQNPALAGLTEQVPFLDSSKFLLGLCIVLAIAFTVSFNIISRISLSTTKHEYAYTVLWQLFCALLTPFFLPFDRFSISVSPHVLLPFALSVTLWALVDAFLFSAFKYEEASVLSAIFPLNFVFTFVVSVVFFHSVIKPTVVVGFLIIMSASLLIGLYHTRFRPSKGIVFALLYSFFQGVALGFNSEVVKSFSIPSYMFAAFLFPAVANLFVFLRPKGAELRYELKVQWKKIMLNAAVMDASFFFLLKAFELGNVPQVVALSASSTLLTALAGVVILKEDKHIALKIFAAGLATLGIILVQR